MTIERLRAAYPGAADAVELHEDKRAAPAWERAREGGLSPTEVVAIFKKVATLRCGYGDTNFALYGKLDQFDHPDFLRYVAGKLGAC